MGEPREVKAGKVVFGAGHPIVFIAGPCVIENEKHALESAEKILKIMENAGIPYVYKSSYDKANRSSVTSYRGPGIKKGLEILKKVKETFDIPVLSDVHKEEEIDQASEVLDILQVPAFLCRQTDLVIKAAESGRVVNIKKGQFLAPWDVKNIISKIQVTGNNRITITERGVSFGYNNLVSDFRALPIMREFGFPVIYDATHSVQLPGGAGETSSGEKKFVPVLARAAAAAGCDGIFMEVHPDPKNAPCDGPNMLNIDELPELLEQISAIDKIVRGKSNKS